MEDNKWVHIEDVWVSVDVGGTVINPRGGEAQVEGAVIDGISQLAAQAITLKAGAVQESNFHTYPLLRNHSAPNLHIEFLPSEHPPTGIGEPALPPITAAVCNAIHTLTGERVRHLPISRAGYQLA